MKRRRVKFSSILLKMGLVEKISESKYSEEDRKREDKIRFINIFTTMMLCYFIQDIFDLKLNKKFFSISTIYFFALFCIIYFIVNQIIKKILLLKKWLLKNKSN